MRLWQSTLVLAVSVTAFAGSGTVTVPLMGSHMAAGMASHLVTMTLQASLPV
jgi:hypothetical protein